MYQDLSSALNARGVTLVAVSKTQPPERLLELYRLGQRHFAENRVQELLEKQTQLPEDIHWHLIGHLQTNKVKFIAPFVHLIHSVDSLRLLVEINKQAALAGRVIDCLLQFHIAQEETKFGLDLPEARLLLQSETYHNLQQVRLCGVMGMASFSEDPRQVQAEFEALRQVFEQLKQEFFATAPHFKEISMGMSGDWEIAVAAGSTMVRIGSLLFGARS